MILNMQQVWFVTKDNQETLIYHPGTLENYSSYIILNPKKDYGIVVLANAYSSHTPTLAKHLNTQLSQGKILTRYNTTSINTKL